MIIPKLSTKYSTSQSLLSQNFFNLLLAILFSAAFCKAFPHLFQEVSKYHIIKFRKLTEGNTLLTVGETLEGCVYVLKILQIARLRPEGNVHNTGKVLKGVCSRLTKWKSKLQTGNDIYSLPRDLTGWQWVAVKTQHLYSVAVPVFWISTLSNKWTSSTTQGKYIWLLNKAQRWKYTEVYYCWVNTVLCFVVIIMCVSLWNS